MKASIPLDDALLGVDEAALYLRINSYTVRRLAREHKVPGFKVGGAWRFRRADLDGLGQVLATEPTAAQIGRRILVVDDDVAILRTVRRVLELAGHEVWTATGGQQALKFIADEVPDLVLLDLHMEGMSGAELLGHIRARWGFLPVVIMTGYPDGELMHQALQHSPALLVAKPFTQPQLLAAVRQSFGIPTTDTSGGSR